MGECPKYQMMESLRDHNVSVLMNTTKIGFKDTSGFGRACTTMVKSGAVATKHGRSGNGYKAGSMFLDLQSH